MLDEGHVLAISPGNKKELKRKVDDMSYFDFSLGGVREALFSDHNYQLMWKERRGFAKVALESQVVSRK